MNIDALKRDLVRDEGLVLHAYPDSLKYLTIGVGRLIDQRRGGGISEDEAMFLLGNDIDVVCKALDKHLPWWRNMSEGRQRALCNMCFQLGMYTLLSFGRMLDALQAGDYEAAAKYALDSKWAKQTPERANRIASMLRG